MIQLLVKIGLGIVGGVVAGPLAPLGGAVGYAVGEFIFDDSKEYLEPEELAIKYAVKLSMLTAGGVVGGFAGEALGCSVGAVLDGASEVIPGDISNTLADMLLRNETIADSFNLLCNLTKNSCLSEEAKAALIRNYFDNFETLICNLINDGKMEEIVGREIAKRQGNDLTHKLIQKLLEELDLDLIYA